jgi:TolB-like protein/cytochrome c-type biogenesis protein CcmH/NrfG
VDAGPLSIVVLPFTNLTGDPNQAYVADGLTASLTADLVRIREAFIVDAKTAFAYKEKPVTAQQVGKDLGVHFVLQGSVQRNGTKIRINAQLADATSNAQLWSESFEGDQSDLFALQDRVTTLVGNSIGREMFIVAARGSEARKRNPTVADLMLRAWALEVKSDSYSLSTGPQLMDLYHQVLKLDPDNADAMASLASWLANEAEVETDESVREKKSVEARDLALRAKVLDPDNPYVYNALASYAYIHGDWEGGLRAAETRLSLEPKSPAAYNNVAAVLIGLGEPQRAIELLTKAINLRPKHTHEIVFSNMGRAYLMLGDNDAAIESFLKASEKNPADAGNYAALATAYALKQDNAKAQAAAAEFRRLDPNGTLSAYRKQISWYPAAYLEWFDSKLVPAAREAGLPE